MANYSKPNALIVPINAIQHSEAGDYLFVNKNGTAKRVNVKVGSTYGGESEILSGITAGDEVVIRGASDIEDGDKIKVSQSGN